jgi:CHRD domain-containing protein/PEP-CTERM motif-containing protein
MLMRVTVAVVLCLAVAASAHAQSFQGTLNGVQENPDVVTSATGFGTAVYDPGTQMLTVNMTYSGLSAPASDAHIHCCSTSDLTNAVVAVGFTGAGGFVTGATSGVYSHVFDLSLQATYGGTYFTASGGTAAQARDRLLNAMTVGVANDPLPGDSSIAYFNIHTSTNPGGEIRGNIAPVPEPTSLLLLSFGWVGICAARRRR